MSNQKLILHRIIASVDYVVTEMQQNHTKSEYSKLEKNNTKVRMTWRKRRSTVKCDHPPKKTQNQNLAMLTCTNQNLSQKMKRINLSGTLGIQTDHQITVRILDRELIDKKNSCGFCCSSEPKRKNRRKQRDKKYLNLGSELKKQWNMNVIVIPSVVGVFGTVPKSLKKKLRDHQDYSAVKINKNTKSPKGLRKHTVNPTSMKSHQLKLGWKLLLVVGQTGHFSLLLEGKPTNWN